MVQSCEFNALKCSGVVVVQCSEYNAVKCSGVLY